MPRLSLPGRIVPDAADDGPVNDMGELLTFHPTKAVRRQRDPSGSSAEIILFPGIRYVRMPEQAEPKKQLPRRPLRRNTRQKKEKAS